MSAHPLAGSRELVLASAGSGKTFRISSRIIGLLAAGEPPAGIFASTFTRKAAGEILERVLVRLARAAGDPDAAAELGEHVSLPPGATASPAFWTEVLARTVRRLHELEIGTLDAFFGRALRSFGHELGLPPGWWVADEPILARIRARALEAVLAGADPGVMVELVRGVRGVDAARSIHEVLMNEVGDVARLHRDVAPDAPGWSALRRAFGDGDGEEAGDASERLSRTAHALADEASTLELPETKGGTPRANWRKAAERIRTALAGEEWADALSETLVRRALADEAYDGVPCPPAWCDLARRLAGAAATALAAPLQLRADAMQRLGERYVAAYDAAVLDEGTLAFDDVVRLLSEPRALARPELEYRLDGRLRHLLLDEFQDTSLLQWHALVPLADALVGAEAPSEGSASVVADPKQSIYGWRGAAPVIVDALAERYALTEDRLAESWRSSQVVLDVVNWTFDDIEAAEVFEAGSTRAADAEMKEDVDRATAAAWSRNFDTHTAVARPEGDRLPGYASMVAGPELEGRRAFQPALLNFAADRVAELHARAPGSSIGVLVRTNEAVAHLIRELRRREVPASEEGGTRLADDPAVVSVLALLRLADHPGDGLAAYHVARTPVGGVLEAALGISGGLVDETDIRAVARAARGVRRRLVHDGYGPTLSRLREALAPRVDARGELRLGQLVELGHRHDDRPTLRSTDFVALAESARVESAGDDPVRVMTVWGSKGLEFDAVVLPQLHDTLVRGPVGAAPPLAHRPTPTGPVTHVFPPMNADLRALFAPRVPELELAYRSQRSALVRDALSGLYVAMTRAKHELLFIVPADGEKVGSARTAGALLREKLTPDPDRPATEGEVLFTHGDSAWAESLGPDAAGSAPAQVDALPEARVRLTTDAPPRRHLSRRSPSDHGDAPFGAGGGGPREGSESSAPLDLFAPAAPPGAAIPATVKGSVVHRWLEEIDWLGEGDVPDPLRDRESRLGLARRTAPGLGPGILAPWVDDVWNSLAVQLEAPEIRAQLDHDAVLERLLARGSEGGEDESPAVAAAASATLEVRNELRFLVREGRGLVEGVVDRLVLARSAEGRIVAAQVLDWKTDAVGVPAADDGGGISPADDARLAQRVELYGPQLADYRAAVADVFGLSRDAVACHLAFLEIGRVVEV